MRIETKRTCIEILDPSDYKLMLSYHADNKKHLSPWEPKRDENYFTKENWELLLSQSQEMAIAGTGLKFTALNLERTEVIGVCNFNNIIYGVFQACQLGYSVGAKYQGQGYMTEILEAGISYVFEEMGLHRVMANYIPTNIRSGAILNRLGFEQEGLAKSYLKIAGKWEDHILTSKINPNQQRT